MNRKGFTIIEVLVTLIILSMIAMISSNILQSSLISEKESSERLSSMTEISLASSSVRRDIRQIVNVSIKDFYGNKLYGTFISDMNKENLMFTTKVKSFSNEVSPLKRVEYVIEDKNFIRKQYYSSNPYTLDSYNESILIKNIDNFKMSFLDSNYLKKNTNANKN
jgi:type II secretion system protein J